MLDVENLIYCVIVLFCSEDEVYFPNYLLNQHKYIVADFAILLFSLVKVLHIQSTVQRRFRRQCGIIIIVIAVLLLNDLICSSLWHN